MGKCENVIFINIEKIDELIKKLEKVKELLQTIKTLEGVDSSLFAIAETANVNLKKLRKERGITQVALSELINVPQSTIATWETGRAFPRAEKLPAIAKALGCTVDELLQSPAESA